MPLAKARLRAKQVDLGLAKVPAQQTFVQPEHIEPSEVVILLSPPVLFFFNPAL
jgi:hypothetical protein